jgi:phosphatidylinositol alpha-mannosyltransferase
LRIGLVCPYSLSRHQPSPKLLDIGRKRHIEYSPRAGGVQTHALGLAGWLVAQGHFVRLLAPDAYLNRSQLDYFGLSSEHLVDAGAGVELVFNGSVAPINNGLQPYIRTSTFLNRGDFDLIHVHEPVTPGVSMLATWAARCPVVATFHTDAQDSVQLGRLIRHIPKLASKIAVPIAVSQVAAEVARRRLGIESRIIPNAIPVPSAPAEPITRDPMLAVFVGRFDEPRKGFQTLLDAVPIIRETFPAFRLTVIGEGTPVFAPGVDYLGAADDATRDRWLRRAALLVAPSLAGESFGIVLIEALANGAGVVASDIPGYAEVLGAAGCGVFVPAGEHRGLAEGIIQQLARPLNPERNIAAATRFSWPEVGAEILDCYRSATMPTGGSPKSVDQ